MAAVIARVRERLGEGWEMAWGPPPPGVFLLKEQYLAEIGKAEALCQKEDVPVVYIVASLGHLDVVYGRVKPMPTRCTVVTFWRRFPPSRVKEAVKTLVDYAVGVDRVPMFQLNPEVLKFADLCGEYPLICDEPVEVVRRMSGRRHRVERVAAVKTSDVFLELVKILREKTELDAGYIEVVKKVVEDPDRLRLCYA